jgi:NAD(P)-dependent dehydrogenase (short-subunit alcohol dehydrogenase family)
MALAPGSEIWLTNDETPLTGALERLLRERGLQPRILSWHELPSTPTTLGGLIILAPAACDDHHVFAAFRLLRLAGPALCAGSGLLATVSRLDGAFGLIGLDTAWEPTAGSLAGLTKTAGHEWPNVAVKAIDLAADLPADEAVLALVDELFRRGPSEVGITRTQRYTLELTAERLSSTDRLPLTSSDVVVISGGARGVTAEAALALAKACQPTLVIMGRSPEPTAEPDWLAPLTDDGAIKKALQQRAPAGTLPKTIGEQAATVVANREVRRNLDRLRATGARVDYRAVDVRDANAVADVLRTVRRDLGPITGLIHGAGVLADRMIVDKTDAQFERVWATKVGGLRALLQATEGDQLTVLALFSSSTGRFGRSGQSDYAAANELLNKVARREARRRPGCRVVAVNWGPWAGGMVTPGLRPVFEREGVGLIPLEAGAQQLVNELSAGGEQAIEVVILGPAPGQPAASVPAKPASELSLAFERVVSIDQLPVLRSHVLDGRAVLPLALSMEWLAHAALHGHPGLAFHGFNDLRVLSGVIIEPGQAYSLRALAGKARKHDGLQLVSVELRGQRADGREVAHVRAEVILATSYPANASTGSNLPLEPYPFPPEALYRDLLFHGPDLHAIARVDGWSHAAIAAKLRAAPPPANWLTTPLRGTWLSDPMAIDGAFQLMILWTQARHGAGSLPTSLTRYRQFRRAFPGNGVRVFARIVNDRPHETQADLEFRDADGQLVASMEGYQCVVDRSLTSAFQRNELPALSEA